MAAEVAGEDEVHVEVSMDCRYAGQSHELRVASVAEFHVEHERRNGYARPDHRVEVVALRARAWVDGPVQVDDLDAVDREVTIGPSVIAEADCTIWVPSGWRADVGVAGALILTRDELTRGELTGDGAL